MGVSKWLSALRRPGNVSIALLPAYNEAKSIASVLDRVAPHVDAILVVDDCSTDETVNVVRQWGQQHEGAYLVALPHNVGASGALRAGYVLVSYLLRIGVLAPDDVIVELDSDGQHDPIYIPQLLQFFREAKPFDVVLTRRDFSVYPAYKRIGNCGLSLIASIFSDYWYRDVESNFRASRVRVFPELLKYFSGYRYSGAFEVGIIHALCKQRIHNEMSVNVPFYRPGASAIDGLHVLMFGLIAMLRVRLGIGRADFQSEEELVLKYSESIGPG